MDGKSSRDKKEVSQMKKRRSAGTQKGVQCQMWKYNTILIDYKQIIAFSSLVKQREKVGDIK